MAEVDPVILELIAKNDRYLAEVRSATRTVDQQLGLQEKRVQRLENEFRNSSGKIGATMKGLAATLATVFTGRELIGLLDGFTRLQNQLRVAGLEGQALADVQGRLSEIGARYGVSVNSLAELFGKATQAGQELGASQEELLGLTEAVSQSLLITGTSSAQASGAILGLTQALASGTVRAEEYAQINEGGLRPLLQAAAAADRFGGSVTKLRAAIYEGTVSSQELYSAILENANLLESQASNATLTLSGAFQTLRDQLQNYVGEASASNGATAALAEGISALARNIDVIIPALAVLAASLGVGVVSNAIRARLALLATTGAMATTAAAARATGAALLTAFGGPVGLAITAIGLALGYVATQSGRAEDATGAYAVAQRESADATSRAAQMAQTLAGAHGQVREEALAAARAEAENTKQKLASARASIFLARVELTRAQNFRRAQNRGSVGGGLPGTATFIQGTGDTRVATAEANLEAAETAAAGFEKSLDTLEGAIDGLAPPSVANVSAPSKPSRTTGPRSRGNTEQLAREAEREAKERLRTAQQAASEERRLESEVLRAKIALSESVDERAELEFELLNLERSEREAQIKNDENFTDEQKKRQLEYLDRLYGVPGAPGEVVVGGLLQSELTRDLDREEARLQQDALRTRIDTLRDLADIEDNTERRNALEQDALALEQDLQRSLLRQQIANGDIADADEAQAQLAQQQAVARERLRRDQLTPGQAYAENLAVDVANVNDALEEIQIDALDTLNDGLVEAIRGTKSLGEVFSNIADQIVADLLRIAIQRAIIEPLAGALFGDAKSASKGGGLGGFLGGLFGRASGGRVEAGSIYRINEGAAPGRVEAFVPQSAGEIVPLGRMNAAQSQAQSGGIVRLVIEEGPQFASRVRAEAQGVSVQVVRAAAPQIVDGAVSETFRRSGRPGI